MNEQSIRNYLDWLDSQVRRRKNSNFSELWMLMFTKEFVWIIGNDDNRIQDAHDLRTDYFREIKMKSYVTTDILGPISVLEIMIALSRRLAFQTNEPADMWAWHLLQNLGLHKMSGHLTYRQIEEVDDRLERLIYRTYKPDGSGGFFPLAWPEADQRKIELWYQMNAYVIEREDPHD